MLRQWVVIGATSVALAGQSLAGVSPAAAGVRDATSTVNAQATTSVYTPAAETGVLATTGGVGNVAHKGASITAPENTLSAVRQAIADGADFVGIDVRRTRDGRLVVLHDARLRRTTDVERVFPRRAPWNVHRFTLAEIRRLDAGSWLSPAYTGERIPTLRQVLRELAPSRTGVFLEIKQPHLYGGAAGIGAQVEREVRRSTTWLDPGGPQGRLVVQAFNDGFLKAFATRYTEVTVGTLGSASALADYATWADQINVQYDAATPALVQQAHAAGLAVCTYVVNAAADMRRVVEAGVDAVSTDRPVALRRLLAAESRLLPDPTPPPDSAPAAAALAVRLPRTALLRARVPVQVRVRAVNAGVAPWDWVRIQMRTRTGAWRTLQRRVTDSTGVLRTTLRVRNRLRLRFVSEADALLRAASVVRSVRTRRARTSVRLFGDRRVVGRERATLHVRWRAEDGRAVSGRTRLWAKPAGRAWRRVRAVRVQAGQAQLRVAPRRDTRYEIRAPGGSWWLGDRDGHTVRRGHRP